MVYFSLMIQNLYCSLNTFSPLCHVSNITELVECFYLKAEVHEVNFASHSGLRPDRFTFLFWDASATIISLTTLPDGSRMAALKMTLVY